MNLQHSLFNFFSFTLSFFLISSYPLCSFCVCIFFFLFSFSFFLLYFSFFPFRLPLFFCHTIFPHIYITVYILSLSSVSFFEILNFSLFLIFILPLYISISNVTNCFTSMNSLSSFLISIFYTGKF